MNQTVAAVSMTPTLQNTIKKASELPIDDSRYAVLNQLIEYIKKKIDSEQAIRLNFICTHNSRRSQLSQIWAKTAAWMNGMDIEAYSGGVEVTAFNERAVASCRRLGFEIEGDTNSSNPKYSVKLDENTQIECFSKVYDDPTNPSSGFAAVMTCSDADKNCPFIPGTEARIPLRYEDPKAFDDTELEAAKYDERSLQIASEMLHIFRAIGRA